MLGSVNSIETMGLVDGPGIRTVIFLNGCSLRCKYCHNPEMWFKQDNNISSDELVKKVLRNKPYFKNGGGVTFSGGEPLLQYDFLVETCKKLKDNNIHIALDTAGFCFGDYEELFKYIDLVLLDIKHIDAEGYYELTKGNMIKFWQFVDFLNKKNIPIWIRQVIVPGMMDNDDYLSKLVEIVKKIKNVERIDFLPYHSMAIEKYIKLGIEYPLKDVPDMDKEKCKLLEDKFKMMYNSQK